MDAHAKKRALFRAKLNAQKKDKRIESPLVRYNESDQPVCRVCDIVLKSESLWDAHQVSRKHREAISNLKANAAGLTKQNNVEPDIPTKRPKPEQPSDSQFKVPQSSQVTKPQSSSVLPPDFFDNNDAKKMRIEKDPVHSVDSGFGRNTGASAQSLVSNSDKDHFDGNDTTQSKINQATMENRKTSFKKDAENKQEKGALPEGFFDNKEADLRARGIKLVKPDVKDEYKEFEKLIQEDLREVDDRLEEEEMPRYKDESPAVRVYTVSDESRYLIVRNVPALGCGDDLLQLFSSYAEVDECKPMDAEECEQFTDVYWIKFRLFSNARFAKRKLDEFVFLGNRLEVSYAPHFESLSDTKDKLEGRRREVLARLNPRRSKEIIASSSRPVITSNTSFLSEPLYTDSRKVEFEGRSNNNIPPKRMVSSNEDEQNSLLKLTSIEYLLKHFNASGVFLSTLLFLIPFHESNSEDCQE